MFEHRLRLPCTRSKVAALLVALLGLACAGGSSESRCRIEVVGREGASQRDFAYRVRGEAGSPAVVSLVAKLGPQNYITGDGVEVGPGPFEAIVELKLTGAPPQMLTMLEVGSKRCIAEIF